MKKVTLIVSLVLMAWAHPCIGQEATSHSTETWWFNFSSSPLIFDTPRYRTDENYFHVGLRNRSSKYITDYDFGCVVQNGTNVTVTKRFWGGSITDGGYRPKSFWPPFGPKDTDKDEGHAKSMCKSSKIAVVWVVFDGGGYWSAPGIVRLKRSF
jgi:hypothetical protein